MAGTAVRTPLVRLHAPESPAEIYLKLENLQPIGSFKLRGAYNAARRADPALVAAGLITASAGNMGQGVAWAAKELGVPCTVSVPDYAPETKVTAMERLGARVVKKPFDEWWHAIEESRVDGVDGLFLHPVENEDVMAGNGTIGLEILEDLPDPDVVLIPYGGGGLTTGIASAMRAERPEVEIYAVEQETAAPLNATLEAGTPQTIEYRESFVDGAGAKALLPKMWGLVEPLIDGAHRVSLDEVASAIRVLAERARVIAEGAGALAPAVALSGRAGEGKIVCVVSGGNIDFAVLSRILAGETP
ncbi:MAG TPA: threonine/serine dehydratase [Gaiellaceae bacterium]